MNKTIQGIGHVFYSESCPLDNVINLILQRYPCAISPCHNRDKNKDGSFKKAHYHILFQGKLTEKDKRYISKITTMNYFENIYDFKSAEIYLYHWNNKTNWFIPNKAQYWSADVIYSERWNYEYQIPIVDNNPYCLRDIFMLIRDNEFREFYDLVNFAIDSCDNPLLDFINNNWHILDRYISSHRYSTSTNLSRTKVLNEYYEDRPILCDKNGVINMSVRSYQTALSQNVIEDFGKINFPVDIE